MNNWIKSILIGLGAAVICFIVLTVIKRKNNKPAYKMHYEVEVVKEEGASEGTDEIMYQTMHVIERRIDQLGYSSSISRKDANHINIAISDDTDVPLTTQAVNSNNKLEFREVYLLSELAHSLSQIVTSSQKFFPKAGDDDSNNVYNKNIASLIAFSVDANGRIVDNGTIGIALKKDTALINTILHDPEVLNSFPRDIEFLYGPGSSANAKDIGKPVNIYAIKTKMQKAPLQNRDIVSAEAAKGFNGQPELRLQFSSGGSRIWERMTAENKGRYIAIIIDKKVISAPHVNDVITGGNSSISGGFSVEETQLLAAQLNSGSIPANLKIINQEIIPEKPGSNGKLILIILVTFIVSTGLASFVFNALKNR